MTIKKPSLTFLLLLTLLLPSAEVASKTDDEDNDIFIGPAVVLSAKQIRVYRQRRRGKSDSFIIDEDQKNFRSTRSWVFKNMFKVLNKHVPPVRESFRIQAFTEKGRAGVAKMLFNMPLNSHTLGPDYERKISELIKLFPAENSE